MKHRLVVKRFPLKLPLPRWFKCGVARAMAFPFQLYKDKGKKEKNVGETKIPQGFSDLGGGNSTSCYFHPDPLGNDPI